MLFSKCNTCTLHCIQPALPVTMVWFLDILKNLGFGHLGLQLPHFQKHVPSLEIGEKNIWQSSSQPRHWDQSSKTGTGRCRRHRAPGWSGSWWCLWFLVIVLAHLWEECIIVMCGQEGSSEGTVRRWWRASGLSSGSFQALWKQETTMTLSEECLSWNSLV